MSRRILLEVCVASVEDAQTAEAGGADRIELNAALELGGLTPSTGVLREVRRAVSLPIVVMVRPRPGGFCCSAAEFQVMQRDVESALEHGADGVAFGILTETGEIDLDRSRQLVEQVGARPGGRFQGAVFHRAFDFTANPVAALEALIDIGLARVLTSGGRETASEGATKIAELISRAAGRIEVLPAGGIRAHNVADLIARTDCNQVHASLREQLRDRSLAVGPNLSVCGTESGQYSGTSLKLLKELVEALSSLRGQDSV